MDHNKEYTIVLIMQNWLRIYSKYEFDTNDVEHNCHFLECDYRRGLDWWMEVLITYTWLGTRSNYSATDNLQKSQINTAPVKP
jgi:hypothetical protein